ncbi:hypothetical protein CEXT_354931 [Caerostris extrusa]|uniref:Uncharacterized protein n=1 Tax=Caerostris extrusa TaxID=172846 RepID=A0AAV4UQH7_CAEEX|nr:hypothetical protein CEXT_354931 [Caerostris extrusa]
MNKKGCHDDDPQQLIHHLPEKPLPIVLRRIHTILSGRPWLKARAQVRKGKKKEQSRRPIERRIREGCCATRAQWKKTRTL